MSKSSSRVKSSSRPTKTDKSPPRKVMKFYEKGDPKQIVDLDSTAMFKNGVLGASHSKGSQERYKKRGHLRQMEDLLAQMNNGEQSTPVRRISPANGSLPQDQQRKDLFFKRYSRPQNTPSKIDHEAIKYHAATVMVAQLEADKQREDKRRRFVVLP